MELANFLSTMDIPHKRSAMVRIVDCCGVCRETVKRWVQGKSKVKDFYKKLINQEFNQEIFKL